LKHKIEKVLQKFNNYLKTIDCKISQDYLKLKLIELDLQYELEDKKQQEREKEQEINKQKKERDAIDKAKQRAEEAEEREKLHQQELDKFKQEIKEAEDENRKQLEIKIKELERQVAEDRKDQENALSESRRLKSGYIYVVSNIGSMDRDIYRICMTSRGDEYIKEMNPNVPFQFDIHFKIYSEDASDTLHRLHQRFDDKRVNLVNSRRDFFKISIDEIEQAVKEIKKKTGFLRIDVFEPAPQAYEYRQTLAVRKKNQQANGTNTFSEVNEIA
jgi:Meiotically up-regulated gene 113